MKKLLFSMVMALVAGGAWAQKEIVVMCDTHDDVMCDTVCVDGYYDDVDSVWVDYQDDESWQGLYGDKNESQLMAIYKKGDWNAGKYLASIWTDGDKSKQMKGIKLLEKITKKHGDAMDWYTLGLEYYNDKRYYYNEKKGLECMRKSADLGYWEAQLFMGDYYAERVNVEGNAAMALEWYSKLLEDQPAEVYARIGDVYADERNTYKDYEKAVYLYHKAGDVGDFHGYMKEAQCYRDGKGVEKDLVKALNIIHETMNGDCRPWGEERAECLDIEGQIALELGQVERATACWSEIVTGIDWLYVDDSSVLNDYMVANAKEYVYENDFMVVHFDRNSDVKTWNSSEVDFKFDGYNFAITGSHFEYDDVDELLNSFGEKLNELVEEEHNRENVVLEKLDDMIVDGKSMIVYSLKVVDKGGMLVMLGKIDGDNNIGGIMMEGKMPDEEMLKKVVKGVRWK